MITFENVTKNYSSNVGLDNVSVHIEKGDFVFLVGPSGAGKSTFIKLILKEINADRGRITACGMDVTNLSNREIPMLRRKIGMVFQDFRLLPKMTVYENVAFAMEIHHQSRRKIRKRVPQILSLVGISDKADHYPDELSAGEQQRVAIARAIINNPTMLIADEPTGNLDPDTAWEIMDLLNQINMTGTTIVMVTHAKDIVDRMGKRVVAIDHGRIVRDEFGAYGFVAEETPDVEAEEAQFKEEMYEAETEDTEVDYDDIAVDEYESEPEDAEELESQIDDAADAEAVDEDTLKAEPAEECDEPAEAETDAVETEEKAEETEAEAKVETEETEEAEEISAEKTPEAEIEAEGETAAEVEPETEEETEPETVDETYEAEKAEEPAEAVEEAVEEEAAEEAAEETAEEAVEPVEEESVEAEETAEGTEEPAEETAEAVEITEEPETEVEEAEALIEEATAEQPVETEALIEEAPAEEPAEDDFHARLQALQDEIFGNMSAIKATHSAQDERLASEKVVIIAEEEGQGDV